MAVFKDLYIPPQWKDEWTKYPHGYTIFEALSSWVSQTNEMVDYVNNLLTDGIQKPLRDALDSMANSGELGELIQELIIIDGGEF